MILITYLFIIINLLKKFNDFLAFNPFRGLTTSATTTEKTYLKPTSRSIITAKTRPSKILEFQTSAIVEYTDAVLEKILEDEEFLGIDLPKPESKPKHKENGQKKSKSSGTTTTCQISIFIITLYMLL